MEQYIFAHRGASAYAPENTLEAFELAAKAADVRLMEVRLGLGIGGKSFVTLSGEVAAVQSAIDAGMLGIKQQVASCEVPKGSPVPDESYSQLPQQFTTAHRSKKIMFPA